MSLDLTEALRSTGNVVLGGHTLSDGVEVVGNLGGLEWTACRSL